MQATKVADNQVVVASIVNYAVNLTNEVFSFTAHQPFYNPFSVDLNNGDPGNSVISNTFHDDYEYSYRATGAPNPILDVRGNDYIEASTNEIGSPTIPWAVQLIFNSPDVTQYRSYVYDIEGKVLASDDSLVYYTVQNKIWFNHLQFATMANNTKGTLGYSYWTFQGTYVAGSLVPTNAPVVLGITVDGQGNIYDYNGFQSLVVNFDSNLTLSQNVDIFVSAINVPFKITVTVPDPWSISGGDYFLFSSSTTDYYAWYKVQGVGTDPAISGRTGVEVDIFNDQTAAQVATATADALNSFEFSVPAYTDVGYTSDQADNGKSVAVVYL